MSAARPASGSSTRGHIILASSILVALAAVVFFICFEQTKAILDQLPFVSSHLSSLQSQRLVEVVDTARQTTFVGVQKGQVDHFQNIFYGEDTSGGNRFAPPVPYTYPIGSVVDATEEGAWCPQGTGGPPLPFTSPITNISENCLSLRIARPSGANESSRLPVVVWLHGGGHALGSTYDALYTPDGLIQRSVEMKQPVIFVGINYRLGVFGFASNKWLLNAKQTNAGLRDQRAALDWVAKSIHLFGGDSERVTAMGQSVGASDIGLHLTSFGGSEGVPFQRAIMMSGATGLNFNTKSDLVANNTAAVAKALDCDSERGVDSYEAVKCLRTIPMERIANVSVSMMREARPPFGEAFFHPTFDDDYIPDRPSELLRKGRFVKNIPHIASWVANDGAWYAPSSTATDKDVTSSFTLWMHGLSQTTLEKLLSLYPVSDFESMAATGSVVTAQYYRAAQMNRDLWFTCPVIDFTWQYARHGGGVEYGRVYQMNQTRFAPAYKVMGVPFWRVAHLSDIPYVLNSPDLDGFVDNSAEQKGLSLEVSAQIIAFANERGSLTTVDQSVLNEWEPAYGENDEVTIQNSDHPHHLKLNLFGGPYGNGMVSVSSSGQAASEREAAMEWQKLFARCEFINSAEVREELSV